MIFYSTAAKYCTITVLRSHIVLYGIQPEKEKTLNFLEFYEGKKHCIYVSLSLTLLWIALVLLT